MGTVGNDYGELGNLVGGLGESFTAVVFIVCEGKPVVELFREV